MMWHMARRCFVLSAFASAGLLASAAMCLAVEPTTHGAASGFERAIGMALPRTVKLYGLGAGVQEGYGTGVIISPEGRVLTVLSLLLDTPKLRATTADGQRYEANVLRRDKERQLALLQLVPRSDEEPVASDAPIGTFPYFDVCTEPELRPGDWVLAAGNSFKVADGAEPVSLSHGVFSTRTALDAQRRVRDFPYDGDVLVIDAITSNPGAPGSALVNIDGAFVGLIGRVVMSNLTNTHFNYAMPGDVVCQFVRTDPDAANGEGAGTEGTAESSKKPVDLGIRIASAGYQKVLPFVERVRAGSPAEKAGVRKDDLILSVNGRAVADAAEYQQRMESVERGRPVTLVIRRGRAIVDVQVNWPGGVQ